MPARQADSNVFGLKKFQVKNSGFPLGVARFDDESIAAGNCQSADKF